MVERTLWGQSLARDVCEFFNNVVKIAQIRSKRKEFVTVLRFPGSLQMILTRQAGYVPGSGGLLPD
jgi:hypothetical protein